MPAKRRIRWLRSDASKEMGRNAGSDDEVSGLSGEDAIPAEPKEMPLKRAEERSPEDVEVSPAKGARRGRVGLKTKTKRAKKPPPASQSQSQEEDADAVGDSGDASPEDARAPVSVEVSPARSGRVGLKTKTKRVKKPPPASQSPDEDADAAGDSGAASPEDARAPVSVEVSPARSGRVGLKTKTKRVKKPRPASQSQEEDAAGDSGDASPARANDTADNKTRKRSRPPPQQGEERPEKRSAGPDGAAASAPRRKKKSKRSDEKKDRRKKRKNKKKKLRKTLAKPSPSPSPSPPELQEIPSSPDIAQEDRVMTVQEQSNTSPPQDEHRAREEEQQAKKVAQQEHGEEEQPEMEVDEETRIQVNGKALQGGKKAPSTKPHSSETEKKPSSERLWSCNDELKILTALESHAKSHDGALPESSDLLANLTFDKIDANEDKLSDKIRKLRARYFKLFFSTGCPPDAHGRQLYKLSAIIWGQDHEVVQIEPTSRDLSVLSELYPHLFKEVSMYAETHSSGALIMAKFQTIGDEKARDLDAKCKKQQAEAFKLEQGQASLTNTVLSAI